MIRLALGLVLIGCAHPAPPVGNVAVPDLTWADRAHALCAAIGADDSLGIAALALREVKVGEEMGGWGTSNGYGVRTWKVVSPPWHAIGIVGFRARIERFDGYSVADKSFVVATWIESSASIAEVCGSVGLAITNGSCTKAGAKYVVHVTTEEGFTRLACAEPNKPQGH